MERIDDMDTIQMRVANQNDTHIVSEYDRHVPTNVISDKIARSEIYVAYDDDNFVGWLRFGLFWDIIPFMYLLEILPEYRGVGIGRQLVQFWEEQMQKQGHTQLLTSTQQNEHAQHFYTALGYIAVGGFVQNCGALTDESFEIILAKELKVH